LRKNAFTQRGRDSRANGPPALRKPATSAYSNARISTPRVKPAIGELTIGTTTFHRMPLLAVQPPSPSFDQIRAFQSLWAAASAAPHRPPISACDEDDGSPIHQVTRFQLMPPASAQTSTCEVIVTTSVSTRPEEMVLATAVPANAPIRFITAASITACPGESTLVATTVAMELAVSWKPLMNSNTSADRITSSNRVSIVRLRSPAQEFFSTISYATTPASRQRSMAFSMISKNSLSRNMSPASRSPE